MGDVGWLTLAHAEAYARDEGFDATFELLVADILVAFARAHDPSSERAFIAARGPERLGSVFCVRKDAETAQLRLLFLSPAARGFGLGRRLLDACVGFAREAGYRRMVLWTHESHRAAGRLYAATGWTLVRRDPKVSFGVDVVEQGWERRL